MKTRMRRFWVSVSLAAGSLAFPFAGSLWSHDLPTRWTSGANSTPSWNYLLDDCLDTPVMAGPTRLTDGDRPTGRALANPSGSCPAEWAASLADLWPVTPLAAESELLARNPISRFSKEMTCWVNEWQQSAQDSSSCSGRQCSSTACNEVAWADAPEMAQPPAPDDARLQHDEATLPSIAADWDESDQDSGSVVDICTDHAQALSDTCAFDAAIQPQLSSTEMLAAEVARAEQLSVNESMLKEALADAEQIEAACAIDSDRTIDNSASTLCGGQSQEILTSKCFPNRFAPGIVDEYMAYDMNDADAHWLGGLGKSWKLRSAVAASPAMPASNQQDWPPPVEAPEAFWAPDATYDAESQATNEAFTAEEDEPVAVCEPTSDSNTEVSDHLLHQSATELPCEPDSPCQPVMLDDFGNASDATAWNTHIDRIVEQAHRSTLALLEGARQSAAELAQPAPELISQAEEEAPNASVDLFAVAEWVEMGQCWLAAELCGFDSIRQAGSWLACVSAEASSATMHQTLALGGWLDADSIASSAADVLVVYVDAEGGTVAVPGSLARAWNRPELEQPTDPVDVPSNESIEEPAAPGALGAEVSASWYWDANAVRRHVITIITQQLDSLGMACLQTSDQLSGWAEGQIASRQDADVR